MKLLIHSQTSMAAALKFENVYKFIPHFIMDIVIYLCIIRYLYLWMTRSFLENWWLKNISVICFWLSHRCHLLVHILIAKQPLNRTCCNCDRTSAGPVWWPSTIRCQDISRNNDDRVQLLSSCRTSTCHKNSTIRHTKSQNSNASCVVLPN